MCGNNNNNMMCGEVIESTVHGFALRTWFKSEHSLCSLFAKQLW